MDDRDITDCLMNLPCFPSRTKKEGRPTKRRKCSITILDEQNKSNLLSYTYDSTVEQCYLNLPEDMVEDNPSDLGNIKERQDHDEKLMQSTVQYPEWYTHKTINDVDDILCYIKPGDNPANWKIALLEDLIKPTIKWYHQGTGHPGSKRLYGQLRQRYYHRDLRQMVDNLNCDLCQRNKLDGKEYGFLPEREVHSILFEECTADLIGPWTVQIHGRPFKFESLTVIDTVTNLVELVRIEKKNLDHIMQKFAQFWLTCYPWPQCCIHDPGGEFTGPEFQTLLQNCYIRDVCTTAKNPQSSAMCKRMHQMVGNILRTSLNGEPPPDMASAKEYINEALSFVCVLTRPPVL